MDARYGSVACGGVDVHYKFSTVTLRDAAGRVVAREKLDHRDRGSVTGADRALAAGNAAGPGSLVRLGLVERRDASHGVSAAVVELLQGGADA